MGGPVVRAPFLYVKAFGARRPVVGGRVLVRRAARKARGARRMCRGADEGRRAIMCWACNPLCGRCKPPKRRQATCFACDTSVLFSKEDFLGAGHVACPTCGADIDLTRFLAPANCRHSGLACAWPCKRSAGEDAGAKEDEAQSCPYHTPVCKGGKDDGGEKSKEGR